MKTLGVGIIGCGWVAGEYIKAFEKDPRSQIRGLFSRTPESAERYRRLHDLQCPVDTEVDRMLARDDIHIAVVSTPHNCHTQYVVAAAKAGKHVIVEKPLALTMADVKAQQKAVADAGVKSIVGYVLHWNPLLMTIDRLIDRKVLGDVFLVEVDYLHRIWMTPREKWLGDRTISGTAVLTGGCHAIDALRWFARSEIAQVTAYQTKTDNPIEYPGTISVNVTFDNGRIGRSTTTFDARMPYRFNIGVYGTEGTVRNNEVFAPKLFPGQTDFMKIPTILPDSGDVAHHPFQGEVEHFLDCIINDTRPYPDIEDAAMTNAACIAADLSAQTNRPVTIKEILTP